MNIIQIIRKAAVVALLFAVVAPEAIARPAKVVVVPGRGGIVGRTIDVQRALARRGLYNGPIDGIDGPRTSAAIRVYQARHGLKVTGDINPALLASLGI